MVIPLESHGRSRFNLLCLHVAFGSRMSRIEFVARDCSSVFTANNINFPLTGPESFFRRNQTCSIHFTHMHIQYSDYRALSYYQGPNQNYDIVSCFPPCIPHALWSHIVTAEWEVCHGAQFHFNHYSDSNAIIITADSNRQIKQKSVTFGHRNKSCLLILWYYSRFESVYNTPLPSIIVVGCT